MTTEDSRRAERAALVDLALLYETERVRFQADFSSAHWLYQVLAIYEGGIANDRRRNAFEAVMRTAKNVGCRAAVDLANSYPAAARIPRFLPDLEGAEGERQWDEARAGVLADFDAHLRNRYSRRHEGD